MPRPQVVVNITAALPRRGTPTPTGTAFLVYAAATGPTGPQRFTSPADVSAALGAVPAAQWAVDAFTEGAPEVVTIRATAANLAAVTTAEWAAALGALPTVLGMGQALIPGVETAAAHSALLTHSSNTGRTAMLDTSGAAADILTAINPLNADNAGAFTPVTVPAAANTTRTVPGSVIAAGLAARGDSRVGHPNHAPAGLHSGGAGVSRLATAPVATYTDSNLDALYDAGVNVFDKVPAGGVALQGWKSLSNQVAFAQLNIGRLVMKLRADFQSQMQRYLHRQIDGRGHLYGEVEGGLRGYLQQLWEADALFGATADDAFDVAVAAVNTSVDAAAGRLRASAEIAASTHVERVVFDIVLQVGQEVAA